MRLRCRYAVQTAFGGCGGQCEFNQPHIPAVAWMRDVDERSGGREPEAMVCRTKQMISTSRLRPGPPPPRLPMNYADELIETIDRLLNEEVFPDAPVFPLRNRTCVTETRKSLSAYDRASGNNLVALFEMLLQEFCGAYGDWRFCLRDEPESLQEATQDMLDHGRGLIAWLKKPKGIAPPIDLTPRCPVELNGEGQSVMVKGVALKPITERQYAVIKMLHDYFPASVTLGQFEKNDILDAHKKLQTISTYSGWEDVIEFPGGKGKGGYRLKPWS